MEPTFSEITKQDAVVRQLREAIRLFFRRGDMLAVHTLVAASFQILEDLGKRNGVESLYRSEAIIVPGKRAEVVRWLSKAENFLKHADRDPDDILRYSEEQTVLFIHETVELAQRMDVVLKREYLAFRLWFIATYPELIKPEYAAQIRAANTLDVDQTDRELWRLWLDEA